MTHAFYPGSFDPFTNGHLDVLLKATKMFDEVVVGVFDNSLKAKSLISIADRASLVYKSYREVRPELNLQDMSFNVMMCHDGATIDTCEQIGASVIIRGLRSVTDYEYELQLAMANKLLNPNIETIFVVPNIENQFVSSTTVRELFRLRKMKQIKSIVPSPVYDFLKDRYDRETYVGESL